MTRVAEPIVDQYKDKYNLKLDDILSQYEKLKKMISYLYLEQYIQDSYHNFVEHSSTSKYHKSWDLELELFRMLFTNKKLYKDLGDILFVYGRFIQSRTCTTLHFLQNMTINYSV